MASTAPTTSTTKTATTTSTAKTTTNAKVQEALGKNQDLQSQIKSSSAAAFLKSSVNSIKSALPSTKEIYDKADSMTNGALSAVSDTANAVVGKVKDSINSLTEAISGEPTDALSKKTTFVTNTSKESVVGKDLTGGLGKSLSDLSKSTIGRVSALAKTAIGTVKEYTDAVKGFANELKSDIQEVVSYGKELIATPMRVFNEVKTEVIGTVQGVVSTVTSSVRDVVSGVTDTIKDVVGSVTSVVNDVTAPIREVEKMANDAVSEITGGLVKPAIDITSSVTDQLNKTLSVVGGIAGGAASAVNAISMSDKTYPNITDKNGAVSALASNHGTVSYDNLTSIHRKAQSICPEIPSISDLIDFSGTKNLFDSLVDLLTKNGLTDLLRSLLECGERMYSDIRTTKVLISNIENAAKQGDTKLVKLIAEYAGAGSITNPKAILRKVVANSGLTTVVAKTGMMSLSASDTTTNTSGMSVSDTAKLTELQELATLLQVDLDEVFKTDAASSSYTTNILSAPLVTSISSINHYTTDTFLSKNIRQTSVAVLGIYGGSKVASRYGTNNYSLI